VGSRHNDAKPDTYTERGGVDPKRISVKVSAARWARCAPGGANSSLIWKGKSSTHTRLGDSRV
jgi:hypothetical protein